MKKIIFLLFLTLFICEGFSQVGKQTSGGIYFLNTKVGWMNWNFTLTSRNVLKTMDGGSFWEDAVLPINWLNEVMFVNEKVGYMQGYQDTVSKLLKTTDGGSTWKFINYCYNQSSFSFINDTIGYSAESIYNDEDNLSSYSILLKTTDGGYTWKEMLKAPSPISSIFVHDIDDITLSGGDYSFKWDEYKGFIMRTKGEQYSHSFNYSFGGIYFLDSLRGFGTGYNDKVYQTSNGGVTWDSVPEIKGRKAVFIDSLNVYLDGFYYLTKTTDGGKTWIPNLHFTNHLVQRCFVDSLNIFERDPYTDPQKFCKSTDGGYTWECLPVSIINSVTASSTPFNYSLQQNYPNPFNPSTSIKYSVAANGSVSLKVYDILGNLIKTLVDEYKSTGEYTVNFKSERNLASGIYFYTIKTGNYTETKKMLLIK